MSKGRFGIFGGQYISETLMNELIRLEECYDFIKRIRISWRSWTVCKRNMPAGLPFCSYAEKMTRDLGGAKIYLKQGGFNHTGPHQNK